MGTKPTPNQHLPFVATETNLLMVELRVKAYPRLLQEAKEMVRYYLNHYHQEERHKLTGARRKVKKLEQQFEENKQILINNGYHPVSLTRN